MSLFGNFLGVALSTAATLIPVTANAQSGKTAANAHDFTFLLPNGEELELSSFAGKPILIVNTATKCGFSNQLADLQELHDRYAEKGLIVLGVPSNDFGGQEPRADGEIARYCKAQYGAEFLFTTKVSVKGDAAHPFYRWVSQELGKMARPFWNFHKYLINPDGLVVASFPTPIKPTSERITRAIEHQLGIRNEGIRPAK